MLRTILLTTAVLAIYETASSEELPPHAIRRIGAEHADDPMRGVYLTVFSRDGKTLATRGRDQVVRLWDVESGEQQFAINAHEDRVTSVEFSLDGKTLATASPGTNEVVRLWDTATGKKLHEFKHGGTIAHFHPNGKSLLVVHGSQVVFFNCETHEQEKVVKLDFTPSDVPLAFSADCNYLLCCRTHMDNREMVHTAHLEILSTGAQFPLAQLKSMPVAAGSSPIGRQWIVSGRRDERIYVIDSGPTVNIKALPSHEGQTQSIAFSPDGRLFATAGWDKTIRLWDELTRAVVCTLTGHTEHVCAVSFSPDGKRLASGASGTTDNSTLLWDAHKIMFGAEPSAGKLSDDELSDLWQKLGGDSPEAYQAIGNLFRAPDESFAFLKQRVGELVPKTDAATIDRLILELDSDEFNVREAAQRKLTDLRVIAEARLRKELDETKSFEVRSRITQILAMKKSERELSEAERRRLHRLIHTLELIGSNEARQQLEAIASGFPNSEIIAVARSSADRLPRIVDASGSD